MLIVHVHIQVKPDQVDAFKAACVENSRNSLQEPGIARFDVLQQQDDPTRFLLVEVYRSAEAPAAHKQTAHYRRVGRGRGRHDGGAAVQREVRQGLPRRGAPMTFEFATAGRILFGRGNVAAGPRPGPGPRPPCPRGPGGLRTGDARRGPQGLGDADVRAVVFNVGGEPTTHLVDEAAGIARAEGCDLVIALGGGSVIDAGKAVAGLLANPGDVLDYLELVGRRQAAARSPACRSSPSPPRRARAPR